MLIISSGNRISNIHLCDASYAVSTCLTLPWEENPLLGACESVRGQDPKKVSCLLYNKTHPSPSLSCRSTKCTFQCADAAGGHLLPTAHLCFIPFFCIQLLHCILTSAASFLGEPHHRLPCLSWRTSQNLFSGHNKGPVPTAVCKIRKNFVCTKLAKPSPILEHGRGILFRGCYFSLPFGLPVDLLWQSPGSGYRKYSLSQIKWCSS